MTGRMQMREKVGNDIYGVRSELKTEQKLGRSADTGIHHSAYFHKYFRGYTEVRTPKANGGYKIQRFYTQSWIVQDVSPRTYILVRLLYALLAVSTVAVYYAAVSMDGRAGNRSIPGAVGVIVSVICLILLSAATINYCFTRRRMTMWDKVSTSDNLRKASLAASCASAATSLIIAVNSFFGVPDPAGELQMSALLLIPAALPLAIWFMERKMPYREEKNDTVLPKGERHEIW